MSHLVVITFDNMEEADRVLEALQAVRDEKQLELDDAAVVVKDAEGAVRIENRVDRGVKVGAVGGGLLGLAIGFLLGGPVVSAALGAVAGAMGGDLANLGIDQRFINDVSQALEPGTSALFVMVGRADPQAVIEALRPFRGKVYYTALPAETEAELRRLLSKQEEG